LAALKSSALWIRGSAVMMTETSSTIIRYVARMIPRTREGFEEWAAAADRGRAEARRREKALMGRGAPKGSSGRWR
jgi:hypothetical protein